MLINFVFCALGFYKILSLILYWTFTLRKLVYWLKVVVPLIELWYILQIKNNQGESQKFIFFWRPMPPLRISRKYSITLHHFSLYVYSPTFNIPADPISFYLQKYWEFNYSSSNPVFFQVSSLLVYCKGLLTDLLASVLAPSSLLSLVTVNCLVNREAYPITSILCSEHIWLSISVEVTADQHRGLKDLFQLHPKYTLYLSGISCLAQLLSSCHISVPSVS